MSRQLRARVGAIATGIALVAGSVLMAAPAQAATTKSFTYTTAAACLSVKFGINVQVISRCVEARVFPGIVVGYVTTVRIP